jgi:mannose-6-phosphate isomerase
MKEPFEFLPLPMERVWGGRELSRLYQKNLPDDSPVGETWEIVDRPEAQSMVKSGSWQGHSLHDLWNNHREGIFGEVYGGYPSERFPILVKLLDARETLSVQVHPPAHRAAELDGEPKTEMWYFMESDPGACIYAGVKEGVTRESFESLLNGGNVEDALPKLPVQRGESIFIPSGRLHAIGGGTVIAEIQQNSDTTYRVFDWNRTGLDGRPRELHVGPSLESIDFSDHAPEIRAAGAGVLADCDYFRVEEKQVTTQLPDDLNVRFHIWGIVEGVVKIGETEFLPGTFVLLPVGLEAGVCTPQGAARVLEITLPFAS